MQPRSLSVKTRLAVSFGSLALVVSVVSGMALKSLNDSNARFDNFVNGINARAELATTIRGDVDDRAVAVRNLVLVSSPAEVEIEHRAVLDAEQRIEADLTRFNQMVAQASDMSPRAHALAGEIPRIESEYRPVALQIVRLAMDGQRDAAVADIDTKCRPLLAQLKAATNAYTDATHQRSIEMVDEAESRFSQQRLLLIALTIVTLGIAVTAGTMIARGILHALGAEPDVLAGIAHQIAGGDLAAVAGSRQAAPGSVLASMVAMRTSLVSVIGSVHAAADSISTGSTQIASGNLDLSSRTEQQAASLQETASSMEELTATVRQNAENAQQASSLSANASEVALRGNRVVGQVVDTMSEISASSARIADITGIIEGIAFQTNILALNAAVEAARAGENGRGFAVVAGEVRTLAQRSSGAAKEIKDLISASVTRVRDGSALAGEAGATMAEVMQAVARVTDIMGEIAAASSEQSKGIEQVNLAIAQMDSVTQQNAALVEEAAAAAQSLDGQGQKLNQAVAFFRV